MQAIEKLLSFALARQLLDPADLSFARNSLLGAMKMDAPEGPCTAEQDCGLPSETAYPLLTLLVASAASRGIITDTPFSRDQFAAHLMSLISRPPSQVIEKYAALTAKEGPEAATNWLHAFCCDNGTVRLDQTARNEQFSIPSAYGELEITINLSKPEKDPREIAKLKNAAQVGYPKCMLCIENEGYAGRLGYPSHETLRTIPFALCGEPWRLQYSPYAYYHEHCILLNEKHTPMIISRKTLEMLLDAVDQLPHYFFGSNADLPIVGGSILNHDHFQGGRHLFPMEKAPAYASLRHEKYPSLTIEAVRWPMTCLRISAPADKKEQLLHCFSLLLDAWREYDDIENDILHQTIKPCTGDKPGEMIPHNTLTPIARRTADGHYILHLVLRNNRTTETHPLGLFHPHADLSHIKKENIGLIEVMGRFILPGRLKRELSEIETYLSSGNERSEIDDSLALHCDWIHELAKMHGVTLKHSAAQSILRDELGKKCVRVLEDAGVFKLTEKGIKGLCTFLGACGIVKI